jgi:predicted ATPase
MFSDERIVLQPTKIDLHIHSAASAHKDREKVKDGTIENIGVLLGKLEANEVNMAAITDHDVFCYEMYNALRSQVKEPRYLRRVLPGVEFTVSFNVQGNEIPVHVITLFDDSDQERVKEVSNAIPLDEKGRPDYDVANAFSEERYWQIIRKIGLDIVTIAHQKRSLWNRKPRKDDANSVGPEQYNEFLQVDYFEAYEYKNRRNELFHKSYAYSRDELEQLRFITGSDCHVWRVYPAGDDKSDTNPDHPFTYLKCLPTFKGLAMAVTDISRIKTFPSFFSGSTKTLSSIPLTLNGEGIDVPLSPGINVIIGDNSIGKSSLLNALNDYRGVNKKVADGQKKYLEKSGLALRQILPEDRVLQFDGQDAIRKSFEGLSEGKAKKELAKHFPAEVDAGIYKTYAMNHLTEFLNALRKSCEYQQSLDDLPKYEIPREAPLDAPQSIAFSDSLQQENVMPQQHLIDEVNEVKTRLDGIVADNVGVIEEEDSKDFSQASKALSRVIKRHQAVVAKIDLEKKVINAMRTAISNCQREQNKIISSGQKALNVYKQSLSTIGSSVVQAVKCEHAIKGDFDFDFEDLKVRANENPVGDLRFVCKLKTDAITPDLLRSLIKAVKGKRKSLSTVESSFESVRDAINQYPEEEEDPIDVLRNKVEAELDKMLRPVKAINRANDDVYEELSRGYNSQMYFALMADLGRGDGIYLVDQPEDQISQKAIRGAVLEDFRNIAEVRQVILITHNPQFIINLDADNVIFLGKRKDGSLYLQSGALEYECSDYKILETVADNIEGGLDTIRKRMKRYNQLGGQAKEKK